ncbi:DUF3006 domain-containing protein [bacterium]|nr:DUF3006 domain-containing protein [bacterium]
MTEKKLRAFVDRVENEYAVVLLDEEGVQIDWPVDKLPPEAVEGTELTITVRVNSSQ